MATIKKLVLDVLKPHQPNALEFAVTLAEQGADYRVHLSVTEMDEKTESTILVITGDDIEFKRIDEANEILTVSAWSPAMVLGPGPVDCSCPGTW